MSRWERIYAVVVICLAAGVALSATDEGDTIGVQSFWIPGLRTQLVQYSVLLFFCFKHRAKLFAYRKHLRGPLPLSLLLLASGLWSAFPHATIRLGIHVVLFALTGYLFGVLLEPVELYRLYLWCFALMVALSVSVLLLLPHYGVSHGAHAGAWRGSFFHKNRAGEVMAVAFTTFAIVTPLNISRAVRWSLAAVALVLLYKAHASTAVLAVGLVIVAQPVWFLLLTRRKALVACIAAGYPIAALITVWAVENSSALFGVFGKDSSLSGRASVWAGVLDGIRQRPLLGYGFQAFWQPESRQLIYVEERTSFIPSHAHNGFLNLWLHAGLVGLLLLLMYLAWLIWIAVREGRATRGIEARWFFSFMVILLANNLTESQFVESPIAWITLAAFYTSFQIERDKRMRVARDCLPQGQSLAA